MYIYIYILLTFYDLTFFLAPIPAFYLAFYLAFCLASILTFSLTWALPDLSKRQVSVGSAH